MAIAFDGEATVTNEGFPVGSLTLTGKTTAGTNRLAVVHVGWSKGGTSTSCTVSYGGTPMTEILTHADPFNFYTALFYLVNPPTGATNVVITLPDTSNVVVAGCSSFNDADQVSPVRASAGADGGSNAPTVGVTSVSGDMVVDSLMAYSNSPSPDGSQTLLFNANHGGNFFGTGSYEVAGGTTTTMSWTPSEAEWSLTAASLKSFSGGGVTTIPRPIRCIRV